MLTRRHRKQRAQLREIRAAFNFAPPKLNRLNEDYIRPRMSYYPPDYQPDKDELCPTCARIDLEGLFTNGLDHETRDGILIRNSVPIGYSDEVYARAYCPFCRLLVDIGDTNMLGVEREVEFWSIITVKGHEVISTIAEPLHNIRVASSNTTVEALLHESIYLALVRTTRAPPGYRFEYRTIFKDMTYVGVLDADELIPPRSFSLRRTADCPGMIARLRDWLARCSRHEACQARKTSNLAYPDCLRLFDITSLRVVDSNGHEPYIALSYPWEQMDEFEIKRDRTYVLESLPSVLRDIIDVVRELRLGINHIWLDRLCIDQEDEIQKQTNIDTMGEVYGAAFATIILAVPFQGKPENGLPGHSAQKMTWQRVENVGRMKLATTLPSLEMTITTSKWNSRAWTFQEGLLSSRCIIYGPEQVFFECAEMGCCESIREPDVEMSEKDRLIPYRSRLRNPFLDTYDFNPLYWRLVRDYTGRDMKFASDSLNAFSAFIVEFERASMKLKWGMRITLFSQHLLWEHEPWDFRAISRRERFPSWSWAGWNGTAAMNFPLDEVSYTCTVSEEPPDGRVLCCHARMARFELSGVFPIISVVGDPGSSMMLDLGMNAASDCPTEACVMEVSRVGNAVHGLLVESKGDSHERIGSGSVSLSAFEAARPQWHDVRIS